MQINSYKSVLTRAVRLATVLLFGVGSAIAQQQVNLTAAPTSLTMPDGSNVPMWGYSCGAVVSGSLATCAASNPKAAGWSPVVITVPTGQDLQINLTNNLPIPPGATAGIPTSLTIVGQLGGGLGTTATSTPSPDHSNAQSTVTWSTVGTPTVKGTPPVQGNRVQSFSTEVVNGATTPLTWTAPRPGTYLLESGTHPSIQASMGLIGVVVVTSAPTATAGLETAPGTAYPGVSYDAELPLIFSEIDPVQNKAVSTAVNTAGFSETKVWSGQPGGCGNPGSALGTVNTCYPPVVNYSPLYYLINGVAFDKTNVMGSLFSATPATLAPATAPGTVLVRLVNAGSRMHVPAIVGSTTGTASGGFSLIAEDGNPLPGLPRVQNEVFMAAGKTYDVVINAPACTPVAPATTCTNPALPVYDRELSLSGNATARDAGMLAYIGINGSAPVAGNANAKANKDTYNSIIAGQTLTISDPGKGVIANDLYVNGVQVVTPPAQGTLTLNANGTFTYVAGSSWATSDSFGYCANGATLASTNATSLCTTVTLGPAPIEAAGGITVNNISYTSNVATFLKIATPGILSVDKDSLGYPLTVAASSVTPTSGLTLTVDPNGGFNASVASPGTYTFTYKAQNSQGTVSSAAATVTLIFPTPSNLAVTVLDGADKTTQITDYRWIIEEDRTFFVDPKCTSNPLPATCPTISPTVQTPLVFGTNFHTSNMPVIAAGCTGTLSCEGGQKVLGAAAVCDQGNGVCRTDAAQQTAVLPSQVHLDPTKRYYISIFPGDAAQPFISAYAGAPACTSDGKGVSTPNPNCGHGMGGAPIAAAQNAVTVLTQPSPYPPATLSVFVFEDDYPLNGEHDAGGGIDILSPQEPGLGGFQITLDDSAGGTGDPTGTPTYDMFNQPLSNSLAGTIDPATGFDACPISNISRLASGSASPDGITGMIVTCPKYEAGVDPVTKLPILSPMAGQAVIKNLYPGRYGVIAHPGADRIAAGEEWLQTNTLDGQKAHDSFMRIGEPGYFQEFGPAGYHVTIGFANPKIINNRRLDPTTGLCATMTCNNEVKGHVSTARMSRTPDERLYGSGSHDAYAFTQCYASLGDPDGEDFAFVKCDHDGNFDFTNVPSGNYKLTLFDQWNDQVVDGISTPVGLACKPVAPATTCPAQTLDLGEVAVHQWQANFFSRTFLDQNGDGVSTKNSTGTPCTGPNTPAGCNPNYGTDTEPGLALVKTNVRFPDGSFSNRNNTDLNGYAAFNEEFPLFNWYVIETDVTRYKNTGTHIVYDAGGPTDGTTGGGSSKIANFLANTVEQYPLPANLSVPGAVYCPTADCANQSIANGPLPSSTTKHSTGRIDPPWVLTEGWQGFSGQNNFLEFGKKPYAVGENGGIRGHVVYSSTRPFDDPQFGTQNVWEPLVPNVTINLYKEGTAPDGTTSLTLVDTTQTTSFDSWAQGFRSDGIPNMNCPGQSTTDPFFYGLKDQPNYLDWYNNVLHGASMSPTALPYHSQFKCYDGMHNWNQLQPAPYDGMYQFPSVTAMDPKTGRPTPTGTNCTACIPNPDTTDPYRNGLPMLPAGKYVTEVVVPPGFELTKEEDKNILIGDNFIAPVTQQFGGLGNIFILPDQAEVNSVCNATSAPQDPTCSLGRNQVLESHEGDTPTVDTFWPCVGALRTVPDYISLFPQSKQVAPFAGASRHLCDRKEVTLDDQTSAQAEFFVWTQTHIASKFTGVITDDFDAEFDPFSPQFGEKFAPAYLPVSIKDWAGNETERTYTDEFGIYNGMSYSTWEVNPPNPTGYAPTMMVTCMNDPGTGATPDPLFQPGYSNFCYELPFMPGATGYFDTPVVPTSAFAGGYNHPDCAYPDATPAISEVDGDGVGPWVSAAGNTLTIKALGDQMVESYGYSGPDITNPLFNKQKVNRHYGFGATQGTVTIGVDSTGKPVPATVTGWSDTQITVTVPAGVSNCAVQQQAQYAPGATSTQCGQLVITAANGKQSVDTVTVTIGGKAPVYVTPQSTTAGAFTTIQSAIDAAQPGDLIMVPPGTYTEMLIMWKPVRLQGVGAVSSVIDANPHPAGRLNPWRRQIVCLFGLALNGTPISSTNLYDPNPNGFTCSPDMKFSVDRLPLEATVGWTATLNGNLAEQLIEPSLMGAYEGAGITVLSKGVSFPTGSDPFASDVFPTGTQLLTNTTDPLIGCGMGTNPFPSNFWCNPSRIDGLTVANSSQGGGGILVHGWGHQLEIANNRVHSNQGTLSGGITVGQGEHPDAYLAGAAPTTVPGSCEADALGNATGGQVANQILPYCFDMKVNIHHNAVTLNSSLGDELFSSTPAGAGGVTMCNGSDYYKFNYNWVCGNMSTGDGAGFAHLGFTKNGDIEHNSILFNQSTNPSITTNGGGMLVMGAPDQDPPCALTNDNDCLSAPNTITPSDGTGPGLVINANLIMGNSADSGTGGGLRLQHVNGNDVINLPTTPATWNSVSITNNIITNNVAGWDGGGVSLQDALKVSIVNNTISSNDSTASAGPLFGSLFAPLASTPVDPTKGVNCSTATLEQSCPQVAGLVSVPNSPVLVANMALLPTTTPITCPAGNYTSTSATNGTCKSYSVPFLANNVLWQNRSYVVGIPTGVGGFGNGHTSQQKVITLYNAAFNGATATTQAASQAETGACPTSGSYWDIGVRGNLGPANHTGGTLAPTYSVLSPSATGYSTTNLTANPNLVSQYCNGSRVPPELGEMGYMTTPGTNETNALPTPVFTLTPSATVDEGNNWVNLRWGPLSLTNPVTNATLGNYAPAANSLAIDRIPTTAPTYSAAPKTDFFGNPRPDLNTPAGAIDIGAVEVQGDATTLTPTLASITPSTGYQGTTVKVVITGTNLSAATLVTMSGITTFTCPVTAWTPTIVNATCTIAASTLTGPRSVAVTVSAGIATNTPPLIFTVSAPLLTSITPNTGVRGTTVLPVTLTGVGLTGTTAVAVSGTGVTATGVTVVNDTTVTANFAITAAAATGARTVTATKPGGVTTNGVTFTVTGPALTSIAPNTGARGSSVPVTLTGSGLTGATAITVSGTGVTVGAFTVNATGTSITTTFTITAAAALTARNVAVTTATTGVSNNVTFTVGNPATATLTSVSPSTGVRGTAVPVTLTGNNFTATGTTVAVAGTGVGVSAVTVVNSTTITATFTISAGATVGSHNVTVTNPNGTASNAVGFTVQGPTLASISPASATRPTTGTLVVPVTFTGTNLTGATGVTVSGTLVTVSNIVVVNSTTVTANFTVSSTAARTARTVSVTTPIGTTNTVTFTVN